MSEITGESEVVTPIHHADSLGKRIIMQEDEGTLRKFNLSKEDADKEISGFAQRGRDEILRYPSQEDGINMDRINSWRDKLGIPKKDLRILSSEDYDELEEIFGFKEEGKRQYGFYLHIVDIVVVRRDKDLELLNGGPEFTEANIVHELVHSGGEDILNVKVKQHHRVVGRDRDNFDFSRARSGFKFSVAERKLGQCLEEGYAELEKILYLRDELKKPDGFCGELDGVSKRINKYLYWEKDKAPYIKQVWDTGYTAPAAILEVLCEIDQNLLSALRDSRHNLTSLNEVVSRINAISPGLYATLSNKDLDSLEDTSSLNDIYFHLEDILAQRKDSHGTQDPDGGS